jgi:tetratricopeptide (TPR) repeat protein
VGLSPDEVGSPIFHEKISEFFARQFSYFRGKARVICDDQARTIHVTWSKNSDFVDPISRAMELVRQGEIRDAIPILWTALQQDPSDPSILYNLGLAYNATGQTRQAINTLGRLLEIAPNHIHGLIAIGVAFVQDSQIDNATDHLERALVLEPKNIFALRNLAACRLKQGRAENAVELLATARALAPDDIQILVSYGTALEEAGRSEEADAEYLRAIEIGGPTSWVEMAKQRRSAMAQEVLRKRGGDLRPDVVMYMSAALERFEKMNQQQIKALAMEIAMLGQSGLDINNPDKKYVLKTIPGSFTGLHLLATMYAAFQSFAPGTDVGINFSQEYQAALALRTS